MRVYDFFVPSKPWVGLLTAFGVVVMFLAFVALRGASERVRTVAAMSGAAFVALAATSGLSAIASIGAFLAVGDFDDESGRLVLDVILLAVGVAAGVAAVLWAHYRADLAAEDLAADELVAAGIEDDAVDGDDPDDGVAGLLDETDPYTASRRRLVAARPLVDAAAVVLALALPASVVSALGRGFTGGAFFGLDSGDVTAVVALAYVANGLTLGAALLVLLRRADLDIRLVAGAYGLLLLRSVVMPTWPGGFHNEFWSAFGAGLVAGLLLAAGFSVLKAAIPDHRPYVVVGALLAVALMTLSAVLHTRAFTAPGAFDIGDEFDSDDVVQEPGIIYPSDLPGFEIPSNFPFTIEPAP